MGQNYLLSLLFKGIMVLYIFSTPVFADSAEDQLTIKSNVEMILVRAGTFHMGSENGFEDEKPVHLVTISHDYYIGKYEVTYDLYDRYTLETGKSKASSNVKERGLRPVEGVNWFNALKFCNWLSIKEGLTPVYEIKGHVTTFDFTANGYRLPTEAEWEYAARGGHKSKGYIHAGSNNPDEVAWYGDNSNGTYKIVGLKMPNELGIHDMNGNMWEWCWDWYDPSYYKRAPKIDPKGPKTMPKQSSPHDAERVRRSGRWLNNVVSIRVSSRSADYTRYNGDNGFRLARNR